MFLCFVFSAVLEICAAAIHSFCTDSASEGAVVLFSELCCTCCIVIFVTLTSRIGKN